MELESKDKLFIPLLSEFEEFHDFGTSYGTSFIKEGVLNLRMHSVDEPLIHHVVERINSGLSSYAIIVDGMTTPDNFTYNVKYSILIKRENPKMSEYYNKKDAEKFAKCNKLISRGATGSSSDKYMKNGIANITPDMVNLTEYVSTDKVAISVNGARKNRLSFDKDLVLLAIKAGAMIIKDNVDNTLRKFNVGERELSEFLEANGYYLWLDHEKGGAWKKK